MSKYSKFNKDKNWLYENYIIKGLTRKQLAEQANVSLATIKEYIKKWDIKKPKLKIDKDTILQYILNGLTTKQIAEKYNCNECTIFRYYQKYNIHNNNKKLYILYNDKNDLEYIKLYNNGKSTIEIAKMFGVSAPTIRYHLISNNIKIRTATERMWNYHNKEIPKDFTDYLKLYNLYIKNGISKTELARRYNCSKRIINEILQKNNIIAYLGDSEYCKFYKKLRSYFNRLVPLIINRDNNTCQLCGCHDNLLVHHIVPFKILLHCFLEKYNNLSIQNNFDELFELAKNDINFNNKNNLITYCKHCHMFKVHNFEYN